MASFLKKSMSAAAVGSVAMLVGCRQVPQVRNAAPPRHYFTQEEMVAGANKALAAQGETVGQVESCHLSTPERALDPFDYNHCLLDVEKTPNDGLVRQITAYTSNGTTVDIGTVESCFFKADDGLAGKISAAAQRSFKTDMRKKFTGMGFTVLGTYGDPAGHPAGE